MNKDIIERIRKCLALSRNNPSIEEAETAALMAQRLIAKYQIRDVDLNDPEDPAEIQIHSFDAGTGHRWKYDLGMIVADNFRCKSYVINRQKIAFYGYETDSMAAAEVFRYLFQTGHRLAKSTANRAFYERRSSGGVYNSFILGYLKGIKEKLGEQCRALMIVMDPNIQEKFQDFKRDFKGSITSGVSTPTIDRDAYNAGIAQGRQAINARRIEC